MVILAPESQVNIVSIVGCVSMSKIHAEMRPWREHLKLCAEDDKKRKEKKRII